ncbi:MAG: PIN domain-containing protein [Acidimicrobiales bacterium]|nr:PIN domain-containing protein [Acidimicrobiales bacterium]
MARSRRRTQAPPPQRLILDSGAVIALSRNDLRARATLAAAREAGVEVSIPSVVVAETVRGSAKDAKVNRVIKSVGEVTAADERTGRGAGALLGAARSTSAVDALVVASAIELGGGVVLTGDPDDLELLAGGHPEVVIRAV